MAIFNWNCKCFVVYYYITRTFLKLEFKGVILQLIGLYNGQTNFDLRLIPLDLSTFQKVFTLIIYVLVNYLTTKTLFATKSMSVLGLKIKLLKNAFVDGGHFEFRIFEKKHQSYVYQWIP